MNEYCRDCKHEISAHDNPFKEMRRRFVIHCVKNNKGCHAVLSVPPAGCNDFSDWIECNCRKVYK